LGTCITSAFETNVALVVWKRVERNSAP